MAKDAGGDSWTERQKRELCNGGWPENKQQGEGSYALDSTEGEMSDTVQARRLDG